MAKTIESVMTRGPVCLDADASLSDAAKVMDRKNIDAVLVLKEGSLCGLVTDRDIATRGIARGSDPTVTCLREICSRPLLTLRPGDAIEDAIARMRKHAVRHMPVLNDGSPIGIVSLADLAEDRDQSSVLGEIGAAPVNHRFLWGRASKARPPLPLPPRRRTGTTRNTKPADRSRIVRS